MRAVIGLLTALVVFAASLGAAGAQEPAAVVGSGPAMQAGQVIFDTNWQTVALTAGFTDPVVVAGPLSSNGSDAAVVQITNVTPTSFQIRLREFPAADGTHSFEWVSYLAVERGSHTLPSGARVDAQTTVSAANLNVTRFPGGAFASAPGVITTTLSTGDAASSRVAGVGAGAFFHFAQAQEAGPQAAATGVNWVAWSKGGDSSGVDPLNWQSLGAPSVGSSGFTTVSYPNPGFSNTCVLATMNSAAGSDTAVLRQKNSIPTSVGLITQEETSLDAETTHLPEKVAVLAIDCPRRPNIEVAGAGTLLNPAVSPQVTRYSIHPGAEGSEVLLSIATPSLTDVVTVEGQFVPNGAAAVLDPYVPGETLNVVVAGTTGVVEFEVFLLPTNFPYLTATVNEPTATDEPLYLSLNDNVEDHHFVAVVDNNGVPFGYKEEPQLTYDFKQQPNGQLTYATTCLPEGCNPVPFTLTNVEFVTLNADGTEVDRIQTVGLEHSDLHEFLVLPNGNRVMPSWEPTPHDLSPFGGPVDGLVLDGIVQEQDAAGNVVYEWSSWDKGIYEDRLIDQEQYTHLNAIRYYGDDMLLSMRGTSQILLVDRLTDDVTWRLGGLSNDFTYVNDPLGGFCGQHTGSILENGNVLLFDNGTPNYCVPGSPARGTLSRVVEYALDPVNGTATLVWSYDDASFSPFAGSSQRLDNGNTFIGWGGGQQATAGLIASEVLPDGTKVFELYGEWASGTALFSYRAVR